MEVWQALGKIFRLSNLGTLIFFCLNTVFLCFLFMVLFPDSFTKENIILLILIYALSIIFFLSPLGEWLLATLSGAKKIKRQDVNFRLIPLIEIVTEQAKEQSPGFSDSINLKIIVDSSPNAMAIGRKTICVTSGLLELSDLEIMAVLAHEMGHIVYKHSTIQLLIGGGNIIISTGLLLIKIICWFIKAICIVIGIATKRIFKGIIITFIGSLSSVCIWLWTKFCMLFLMWSKRQNEYVADEYAFKLGYGEILASVIDRKLCSAPTKGLLKALYSTHPNNDDRIARLQKLGANYSRW